MSYVDESILTKQTMCITFQFRYPEGAEAAYIIGHYAVQQIFCVKNRQGEIIEVTLGYVLCISHGVCILTPYDIKNTNIRNYIHKNV